MKKYIIIAVASILALSGCSNLNDNQNTLQEMTFTAGFSDEVQTRATLDPSTKKVSFDAPDHISIFSAKNNDVKFTTTAGGASATFEGTAVSGDPTYYAIYPYQAGLLLDGSTITGLSIPEVQTAAASSTCGWDPAAPIAYATTTGSSLEFHNACALLKVTNDRGSADKIVIRENTSDLFPAMTGDFTLNTSTGALAADVMGSATRAVTVYDVPADKTVYLAIAPCTVKQLQAKITIGVVTYMRIKSTSTTFEAGKIYDLGNTSDWN